MISISQKFSYRAKDRVGRSQQGIIEAESEALAAAQLKEKGLIITDLQLKKDINSKKLNTEIDFGVSKKELAIYCRQFATMLQSGLPIRQCLNILVAQSSKKKLKDATGVVLGDLEEGMTLSEAMARHRKVFPNFMINLIEAGETGGILDQIFERLANYYQREYEIRQKVVSSLTYPAVVISMSVVVMAIMIRFVLPNFIGVFKNFNAELPLPTRILMGISNFVQANFLSINIGLIILILITLRFFMSEPGRRLKDKTVLRSPLLGSLNKKIITTHFCRTLGTLLAAGIPLLKALDILKKLFQNHLVEQGISNAQISIREGRSLAEPLDQMKIFSPMVAQMITVGEETGTLEIMLERVAVIYDYEVEQNLNRITTMLEPLMILVLALFVGFIMLSILLPMYNLGSVIN